MSCSRSVLVQPEKILPSCVSGTMIRATKSTNMLPEGKGSCRMASIWVESLSRNGDAALDLLAAAMRDCPDDLWASRMWAVPADVFGPAPPGPDRKPVTDPAARTALAQRRATPWSVAWHALETLDYDLTGAFGAWVPPPHSRATRTGC